MFGKCTSVALLRAVRNQPRFSRRSRELDGDLADRSYQGHIREAFGGMEVGGRCGCYHPFQCTSAALLRAVRNQRRFPSCRLVSTSSTLGTLSSSSSKVVYTWPLTTQRSVAASAKGQGTVCSESACLWHHCELFATNLGFGGLVSVSTLGGPCRQTAGGDIRGAFDIVEVCGR